MSNIETIYPLSPLQEGMLFHSLYQPGSGSYVDQISCCLEEPSGLDPDLLVRSFERVVERHPALRTAFAWELRDRPKQVVLKQIKLACTREDWRGLETETQEQRLQTLLMEERMRGFDLARAPLLRLILIRTSEAEHRLVLTYSHLLMDAWSLPVVFREVATFYQALRRGNEPGLTPVRPYRDYIAWLQRQDSKGAEEFWRGRLRGFTAPTPLGGPAPKDDAVNPQGDVVERLQAQTATALAGFARQHRLTMNSLMQAVWALLLARLSGERDVLFGITVAGRPAQLPGVESIVGLFINTLPLRVKVDYDEDLVTWLQRVQAEQVETRHYEYSALPDIQSWSEVPRGVPLFDSILVFENYPLDRSLESGAGGLALRDSRYETRTNYALTLLVLPGAEPVLRLLYDRGRFTADAAGRLLRQARTLLAQIAKPGRRRVSDLPCLDPAERQQLLTEWNDTAAAHEGELRLHAWLRGRAAGHWEEVALVCGTASLTYRELWGRADRLAAHLKSLGIGPESRVGIYLDRSVEMIVALLGTLQAGGAYVPLDPDYPRERLALILEDSAPAVVLTWRAIAGDLPVGSGVLVFLDTAEAWWEGPEPLPASDACEPESLAYVLYTSGSTGRPKGVQIPHRAVVSFLRSMACRPGIAPGDVLLALTSLSFDIAGLEIYLPLSVGSRLVVATREQYAQGAELASLIDSCGATIVQATPATWRMLVDSGWKGHENLSILCGGEALPEDLASELLRRGREVWNLYGPTETTIWSAVDRVAPGGVTLGYAIANTSLHVLDDRLDPVPIGCAGELYIGGEGLSRGYLGRPDLTAERFVPLPFDRGGGARLYRTGDLVRRLADGRLEFSGRLDHQIKVRGYRIEPAEVEAVLRRHSSVSEAVVVGREDGAGSRSLVAYVAGAPGAVPDIPDLRLLAQRSLPPYMVPSLFVSLSELPLTPNGKIDRKALPEPGNVGGPVRQRAWSAGTPVEEVLAGIWSEILPLAPSSPDDDFFALGGHSLLATQLMSRLRQVLSVSVNLPELFTHPTLASLARLVQARLQKGEALAQPPIVPVPRDSQLPLSFAQQRLWFVHRLEGADPVYNLPTATRLLGRLSPERLRRTLALLVERHEILRTRLFEVEGQPTQVIGAPSDMPLPVVDLGALPESRREKEARRVALEEIRRPFDLERGPVLRSQLLCLGEEVHVLLFTLHHIAGDGWSMGVLVREVVELYGALSEGRSPLLPSLPVQYADFSLWQREWLQGEVLDEQISYWLDQLEGVPLVLELPTDRPRPAVQSFRGAIMPWHFPDGLRDSLRALERSEGVTLFMVLLAAFQVVVRGYTGRESFVVGTDLANRNRVETEGLIGFFVNQMPVVARFAGVTTFRQHLRRVREATFGAYAHQDLPFDKLVEALRLGRSLSQTPLLQVKLNLHNFPLPELALRGLSVRPLEVDPGTSKMDLIVDVVEQGGELLGSCQYRTELFESGTVERLLRDLERVLEAVSIRPDAELAELEHRLEGAVRPEPEAALASTGFALSPQQEHLWRHLQRGGGEWFVSRCAVRLPGDVDVARLRRALESLAVSEELLRTTLQRLAGLGTPVQVIADEPVVRLEEGHAVEDGFDLSRGPLVRAHLEGSLLRLSSPSIVLDRGSLLALVGKLSRAYAGELEAEPLQYLVISDWLNELQVSEEARGGRESWLDPKLPEAALSGVPFERTPELVWAFRPEKRVRELLPIPEEEAWLLALWQVLLARVMGRWSIVVGVRFDGRTDEELSGALGFLERYLPVVGMLDPSETVASVASRAERFLARGRELQDVFSWSEIERLDERLVETPYFPLSFELLEVPGDLGFSVELLESCSERFELKLSCVKSSEGLRLELHYDAERLSGEYVQHLGEQLEALLEDARRHPERRPSELDLLGDRRRRELLAVSSVPVRELGLHELFEEQVRRSPEAAAISFGQERWSYRELNERANRLARHLRRQGVGRDDRVALVTERSLEMVLGLLGTLKAGAAYIPVDPGYPSERVSYMLSDSGASMVLTPDLLKSDWSESGENLGLLVDPAQLAYVIYTSGSTGRPKGVMVSHGAIVNQMSWFVGTYPLDGSDVVLQKTPFSFDASVWEFYAPLLCGARLHLAEPGRHGDGGYLARTCRDEGVTVLQLVPSLLRVLLEEPLLAECRSLRRLFCGGEALSRELVVRAQSVLEAEVINLYGPTEATIQVLSWSAERPLERRTIPLGEPVWNTWSYVLDGSFHPCPVGVAGELYVGGAQLARGYLGRPELTAERFVPDVLGSEPGARLYRTGDLARYLPEGGIEFLGRVDQQVKVRGFRIELGEIESVLEEHPSVRQAVVVAREEGGVSRLVAYLIGESLAEGELRSWAGRRLPEHMVPAVFVALEELPRLPNGKVDRSALPAAELLQPERELSGARTPTEELVAQLWSELLGLERVGVEEDFFELGGHSLLATQLTSRLAHLFRVELSLRTLFETPTVVGIASRIDALRQEEVAVEAPPIRPVPRDRELPLSFAQETLWFIEQLEAETAAYNTHLALVMKGRLDSVSLERAINEVVRRHEVLRASFPAVDGHPHQSIRPGLHLPVSVVDLRALESARRGEEMLRLAQREASIPFDLARGPLVRTSLLRMEEEEQVLLFTIHHIISDGWSLGVVTREITALYRSFAEGKPSPLGELPIQYADFACWQRGWLTGEVLGRHLGFWVDHLQDAPEALLLPTDRPRPAVRSYRGERQHFELGAELSADLRKLCRSEGVTPFMLLLSALNVLFYLYSGQKDIVIGSPIANRSRLETEGLIGFFVNTLPLRTRLSGDMSFRELLARVRATVLDATVHQVLPFEKLLEQLRPERQAGRTPVYQAVFTMQNAPMPAAELPGLTVSTVEIDNKTAKFDLTVNVWETANGFAGSLEHSVDLFDAATMRRMWHHLKRLLVGVRDDLDARLDSLEIFSEQENTLFTKRVGIEELDSSFLL